MFVLVTGGTGLLGAHLLYQLAINNCKIKALVRNKERIDVVRKVFSYYSNNVDELTNRISWIEGDILDSDKLDSICKDVDTVYHLAAYISYNKMNKENIFRINVDGTRNIVNACLKNSIKKLCYVSSTSTLGSRSQDSFITEESKLEKSKHTSNYALSKYEAEKLVLNASNDGLSSIIINPSVIIGAGDWTRSSSKMFLNIYQGLKYFPKGIIGFVDVRDVVNVILLLTKLNVSGERFIVSAENISYQELFRNISTCLNCNTRLRIAPMLLLSIKWRIEYLKSIIFNSEPLITKETVAFSKSNIKFSNKKLLSTIDYSFKPVKESVIFTSSLFMLDYS